MKVADAMTRNVEIISPEKSICDAAKLMAKCDAGSIPVADGDRLIGMITDRDIAIRAVAEHRSPDTPVGDVMSREILYCFEDEEAARVAENMSQQKVRRLPVVSRDKRLVGIVSLGDISRKADAAKAGQAMKEIAEPGGAHNQSRSLH